jgi:PadR family transcriptional regulator, regulatory protein PadR
VTFSFYLSRLLRVVHDRVFSAQTVAVLMVLSARPRSWHHGYEVARETGLKSGTLYPIFIRLADRGLLEAHWEESQPNGRPRRHLYRLTSEGLARARQELTLVPAKAKVQRRPAARVKPAVT